MNFSSNPYRGAKITPLPHPKIQSKSRGDRTRRYLAVGGAGPGPRAAAPGALGAAEPRRRGWRLGTTDGQARPCFVLPHIGTGRPGSERSRSRFAAPQGEIFVEGKIEKLRTCGDSAERAPIRAAHPDEPGPSLRSVPCVFCSPHPQTSLGHLSEHGPVGGCAEPRLQAEIMKAHRKSRCVKAGWP